MEIRLCWCHQQSVDPHGATVVKFVNFLSNQQALGKCYTTINSYRSALSSVLPYIASIPLGKHNLVIRLMRGIFNENPPRP